MSVTPVIHPDTIKVIAEMNGVAKLKNEIAKYISTALEHRIKFIVEDAQKVMKHSKREVLSTADINHALKMSNFQCSEPVHYLRSNDDKDLYVEEEKELDFAAILTAELPSCPRECSFDISWLAVEGKQPEIPQNPRVKRKLSEMESTDQATTRENTRSVTQAWAQAAALQKAQQARAKALAEQRQIEEASKASAAPQQRRKTFEPKIIQEPVSTPKVPKEEVVVKPAIPHELPKEVQVYYEKVEEAVLGMNGLIHNILEKSAREKEKKTGPPATTATQFEAFAEVKTKKTEWKDIFYSITSKNNKQIELFIAALQSLWQDPGLYKLLPYLIDFICKNVPKYVNNLGLLTSLMQIVTALSLNTYLDFEEHLHQLLPVILTCVVRPQLGDATIDHHWSLRDYCALLVSTLVQRSNKKTSNVEARVTKFFVDNLVNLTKPAATHYGALRALSLLGPQCTKIVLFPILDKFMRGMEEKVTNTKEPIAIAELMQCRAVIMENTGNYIRSAITSLKLEEIKYGKPDNNVEKKEKKKANNTYLQITVQDCQNHYNLIAEHFEAGLLPYTGHITPYVDLFI